MEKCVKVLVVACNTASSYSIEKLRKIFNIPIIEVIEPGSKKATEVTKNQRIGVLGTKGTIKSGSYQKEILKRLPTAQIFPIACPLFVPLVEEQFIHHHAAKLIVKEYLSPLKDNKIDTLLLGCTHYPLLKEIIQQEVGPEVTIVDSASTCADEVGLILRAYGLNSPLDSHPQHSYYVSDDPEKFRLQGQAFLGSPIHHVSTTFPMNFDVYS